MKKYHKYTVHKFIAATVNHKIVVTVKCGPMPNVMAALSNIGGAICLTPQSLADAQYWSVVH